MDFKAGTNGAITVISASPDNASTAQKAADTVAAGFFHIGPTTVTVHSVREMAIKVVAKADGGKIDRLNIVGHGNEKGCLIGNDWITEKTLGNFANDLFQVVSCLSFSKNCFVHLLHCRVGQNEELLKRMSLVFAVPVYAATGTVNVLGKQWFGGNWTRCSPSGTIYHDALLPGESS